MAKVELRAPYCQIPRLRAGKGGQYPRHAKCFAPLRMVYDPSDNSLTTPNSLGKPIPKPPATPRFIYYNADEVLRYEDENGEIHLANVFLHRYAPLTKRLWAQTPDGRWIGLR